MHRLYEEWGKWPSDSLSRRVRKAEAEGYVTHQVADRLLCEFGRPELLREFETQLTLTALDTEGRFVTVGTIAA